MKYVLILLLFGLASSCATTRLIKPIKKSPVFKQGFSGVMLYDPEKKKTIYAQNEDKYFTPASNIKLLTFYVSHKILEEETNSLNYFVEGDSLVFWGTGNPAFLHPDFEDDTVLDFLRSSSKKLYLADNFSDVAPNGAGWSWNWYNYYYGPERSAFPMYGNIVRFSIDAEENHLNYYPRFFSDNIKINQELETTSYQINRERYTNNFEYALKSDSLHFETDKPFITSQGLVVQMLRDTLKREVSSVDYDLVKDRPHHKLKGIASDSLFKQMLTISDNFLAEQLLVMASDQLFDSLNVDRVIEYGITNFLNDLPDRPIWVDGSGLSSYNKITPRSIIALLDKIWNEVANRKIVAFFPAGGTSGTIKSWYKSDTETPYLYAKTGTLSGTHCLSGYLFAKSGRMLYFSFMHNNYIINSNILKSEMEKVLFPIYQHY